MNLLTKVQGRLSTIRQPSLLSAMSPSSSRVHSEQDLQGFRDSQALAFRCATEIGRELQPGWTEKRTAQLMDQFLRDHGVRSFFHTSFAWFGDHTRFSGFDHYWNFLPSNRVLKEDDVIILDTAPIVNGYAGDIGFTFSKRTHAGLTRARAFLRDQRQLLVKRFESPMSTSEIWEAVDVDFRQAGYDNCHALYPFGVLGHRLHKTPLFEHSGILRPFSFHSAWNLMSRGLFPELLGRFHRGQKLGLWAIEPHVGGVGFGAKFEEILVVEPQRAYWLSDDVPHIVLPEGYIE